jgi:hypothetical protein
MRQVQFASLVIIAIFTTTLIGAEAGERYPAKRHYVNQTGHVVAIGDGHPEEALLNNRLAHDVPQDHGDTPKPVVHLVESETRTSSRDDILRQRGRDQGYGENHDFHAVDVYAQRFQDRKLQGHVSLGPRTEDDSSQPRGLPDRPWQSWRD